MNEVPVRDLLLVPECAQLQLLETAKSALASWALDWLSDASSWTPQLTLISVSAQSLEPSVAGWVSHGVETATGWSLLSERARTALTNRLLQREATASLPAEDWAWSASDRAWGALCERLLGPARHACDSAPDLRPLSGVTVVKETTMGLMWAWCSTIPEPRAMPLSPTLTPLIACLPRERLPVQAGLGDVDIPVSDLLALQVGDVVCFPAKLNGTVPIQIGSVTQMAGQLVHAHLGQQGDHMAIRFLSTQKSA